MHFSIKVSELPRVLEVLPDSDSSELVVFLLFGKGEQAQCYVEVHIQGLLSLKCQRCLTLMPFELSTVHRLSPIRSDQNADDLLGELEPVLMDENGLVDVMEMIEDEVLLGLPMCPMHEMKDCASSMIESNGSLVSQEKKKPFAGLADLLNKKSV